jgi:hypothetical protein
MATPLMVSYCTFKDAHPDCFVVIKVGLFYHIYGEDASEACEILNSSPDRVSGKQFKVDRRETPVIAWPEPHHQEMCFVLSQTKGVLVFMPPLSKYPKLLNIARERLQRLQEQS